MRRADIRKPPSHAAVHGSSAILPVIVAFSKSECARATADSGITSKITGAVSRCGPEVPGLDAIV
jgi:hypothetical protein